MTEKFFTPIQVVLLAASAAFGQIFFDFVEEADVYFAMNLGRYILEHGFPHVDPFTIHEGLRLVPQQWLSGVLFWEVYKSFGADGVIFGDCICAAVLVLLHWRLCLFVSGGNKTLSFVLSFVVGVLAAPSIVPRPQIFSTPLLLLEVFLLEKCTRTHDFKFLLPLPVISVALVNLHAAVWLMALVVCLPFLFVKDARHVKFLLAAMAAVVVCGLANPYGVDAMTYVLRSYGVDLINSHIREMFTPSAHGLFGKCFYLSAAVLIVSLAKFKVPWRYILLSSGLMYMTVMHDRNEILFYFLATFPVAYAWRDFTPPKILAGGMLLPMFFVLVFVDTAIITTLLKDKLDKLSAPLMILLAAATLGAVYTLLGAKFEGRLLHAAILPRKILSLFAVAVVVSMIFFATLNRGNKTEGDFTAAIKFVLRTERPENISLYAGQGYGGRAGMFGIRYYIDSRSEVFIPANNGHKNIFAEYLDFTSGKINYKDFFARYQFTHIFITTKTPFLFDMMTADENFRAVYESERVEGTNVVRCKIFVPKELHP